MEFMIKPHYPVPLEGVRLENGIELSEEETSLIIEGYEVFSPNGHHHKYSKLHTNVILDINGEIQNWIIYFNPNDALYKHKQHKDYMMQWFKKNRCQHGSCKKYNN
jgi:hypothetical protein